MARIKPWSSKSEHVALTSGCEYGKIDRGKQKLNQVPIIS